MQSPYLPLPTRFVPHHRGTSSDRHSHITSATPTPTHRRSHSHTPLTRRCKTNKMSAVQSDTDAPVVVWHPTESLVCTARRVAMHGTVDSVAPHAICNRLLPVCPETN
jgi:hypothetical protein